MIEDTSAVTAIYLKTAAAATGLLRDPAIAAGWRHPSALAKMDVAALAGHLARQLFQVRQRVEVPAPDLVSSGDLAPITLREHYTRSRWVKAELDDDVNVYVRTAAAEEAGDDPAELVRRADETLDWLRTRLPEEPLGRLVYLPWASWSLTLEDFLMTRIVELSIHCDDLAVSVDLPTPPLPAGAYERVLPLLCWLAARRHGPVPVLRALSRSERAPGDISAF